MRHQKFLLLILLSISYIHTMLSSSVTPANLYDYVAGMLRGEMPFELASTSIASKQINTNVIPGRLLCVEKMLKYYKAHPNVAVPYQDQEKYCMACFTKKEAQDLIRQANIADPGLGALIIKFLSEGQFPVPGCTLDSCGIVGCPSEPNKLMLYFSGISHDNREKIAQTIIVHHRAIPPIETPKTGTVIIVTAEMARRTAMKSPTKSDPLLRADVENPQNPAAAIPEQTPPNSPPKWLPEGIYDWDECDVHCGRLIASPRDGEDEI